MCFLSSYFVLTSLDLSEAPNYLLLSPSVVVSINRYVLGNMANSDGFFALSLPGFRVKDCYYLADFVGSSFVFGFIIGF